jgi:hypothetical protein
MVDGHKGRTMATAADQGIFARHIRRFFQVGDRSPARAETIREALDLLNAEDRHWTARSVRLWFTNKKHYTNDPLSQPPPRLPCLPPISPYQCGFIPMCSQFRSSLR